MLDETQIRRLLATRLYSLDGCQDREYIRHHAGVIRGLLWCLNGKDPGDVHKIHSILRLAEIPCTRDPTGEVYIDTEWLQTHRIDPERW